MAKNTNATVPTPAAAADANATVPTPAAARAPANRGLAFLRKLGGAYTRVKTVDGVRIPVTLPCAPRAFTVDAMRTVIKEEGGASIGGNASKLETTDGGFDDGGKCKTVELDTETALARFDELVNL